MVVFLIGYQFFKCICREEIWNKTHQKLIVFFCMREENYQDFHFLRVFLLSLQ